MGSDVYSYGVMLWSFYTGQLPCVLSARGEWVPNLEFPHFQAHGSSCGGGDVAHIHYKQLTMRCLRSDPHRRPTFPEIEAALSFILGPPAPTSHTGPTSITPGLDPNPMLDGLRRARGNRLLAGNAAAAAAAGGGGGPGVLACEAEASASTLDAYSDSRTLLACCLQRSGQVEVVQAAPAPYNQPGSQPPPAPPGSQPLPVPPTCQPPPVQPGSQLPPVQPDEPLSPSSGGSQTLPAAPSPSPADCHRSEDD